MSQDPGQKYLNNGVNFTTAHHDTYAAIDPTKVDLSGVHVLITGASKGVGRATAVSYAKAGASGIILGARSPLKDVVNEVLAAAKHAGKPEPQILALNLDVTNRANVESAAKQVSEHFNGRLDILINNAGYLSPFVGIPETDPDQWWRDFEVNTKGVYLVTRAFWPLILKSSLKIVMNVSSIGAHLLTQNASAYAPSKLASMRFTEYIDADHGPSKDEGIVAINVHPGGIKTELACGMPEPIHQFLVDTVELAGDFFVWLGKERREWLSGRYVSVNWDVGEFEAKKEEVLKGDLLKVRLAVNAFGS